MLGLKEVVPAEKRGARVVKCKEVCGLGSVSAGQRVCVHSNNLHNMIVSLEQRVFRVKDSEGRFVQPPQPARGAFDEFRHFRGLWKKFLLEAGPVMKHTVEEIVDCYSSDKKKLYQKAANSLRHKPVEWRDSRVSAFIKVEKLECEAKDPVPRTIQPRSKRYNLALGQYLRLNEKRMTKAVDRVFGETTILSGLDNRAQGRVLAAKWNKFKNPIGIGLDASRFDQHCSKTALKAEHKFYTSVFPDHKLKELLSWQLENHGSALLPDGSFLRYKTKGCRMSGDINTSLGNKLLMCGMVYCYLREHGIKASLANNGDDCVLFCEASEFDKIDSTLRGWFLHRGYDMVVEEPVEYLERVVFCRSQPVCVGGKWAMIRQLGSLSRDCFSLQDWSQPKVFADAMNALGQCNGIINDGVPVYMSQAKAMYRAGGCRKFNLDALQKQMEYSWRDRLGSRTKLEWNPVEDATRLSFFRAFGIEPQVQKAVEEYFDGLKIVCHGRRTNELPLYYSRIQKDLLRPRYHA